MGNVFPRVLPQTVLARTLVVRRLVVRVLAVKVFLLVGNAMPPLVLVLVLKLLLVLELKLPLVLLVPRTPHQKGRLAAMKLLSRLKKK